jgi:hypothetical protein
MTDTEATECTRTGFVRWIKLPVTPGGEAQFQMDRYTPEAEARGERPVENGNDETIYVMPADSPLFQQLCTVLSRAAMNHFSLTLTLDADGRITDLSFGQLLLGYKNGKMAVVPRTPTRSELFYSAERIRQGVE